MLPNILHMHKSLFIAHFFEVHRIIIQNSESKISNNSVHASQRTYCLSTTVTNVLMLCIKRSRLSETFCNTFYASVKIIRKCLLFFFVINFEYPACCCNAPQGVIEITWYGDVSFKQSAAFRCFRKIEKSYY